MKGYGFLLKIMSLSIVLCSTVSLFGMRSNCKTKLTLHKKNHPVIVDYEKISKECEKAFQEVDRMFTPINHLPLDCLMHIYNYGGFKVVNLLQKTNKEWHEKLSQLNNDGDSFVKRIYPIVAKSWLTKNTTNIINRNLWFTDQDVAKKFNIKENAIAYYGHDRSYFSFKKIRQAGITCRDRNLLSKESLPSLKAYLEIAIICNDSDTAQIIAEILAKTYEADKAEKSKNVRMFSKIEENYKILERAIWEKNEEIFRIIATIDPFHVKNRYYKYKTRNYLSFGPCYYSGYKTFFSCLEKSEIFEEDKKKYSALYKECGGKTLDEICKLESQK